MSDTLAATNVGEDSGSTGPGENGKAAWIQRAVAPVLAKHAERRERFVSTGGVNIELAPPGPCDAARRRHSHGRRRPARDAAAATCVYLDEPDRFARDVANFPTVVRR